MKLCRYKLLPQFTAINHTLNLSKATYVADAELATPRFWGNVYVSC